MSRLAGCLVACTIAKVSDGTQRWILKVERQALRQRFRQGGLTSEERSRLLAALWHKAEKHVDSQVTFSWREETEEGHF